MEIDLSPSLPLSLSLSSPLSQVMATSKWLYLVTEYASEGEIFGKLCHLVVSPPLPSASLR